MKQIYLGIKNILCDIPSDKYLHFIVCMIMTQVLSKTIMTTELSILVVFGIGVLKELFDKYIMKESFDLQDLEADAYGILVGIVILIL